jgi:uncharacterized delta-60 repeat protein
MRLTITTTLIILSLSLQAQFTPQWQTTFNGIGDFSDHFTSLVEGEDGSIYAAGYTHNTDNNADFLVAKFNQQGQLVWNHSWRGNSQGPDIAYAIAFANNIVYATGQVSNNSVGFDFFTIALTAAGDSIWAANYNDINYNQYDQANAICIDNQGNVIVAGESDRDPSSVINDDFLVVKYSPTGTLLWAQRYNHIGNATDRAVAVACDSQNNVVVAGRANNGGDDDYAVIQYGPNGTLNWSRFFDNGDIDRATDMGLDANGNVYVTGRSSNGNDDDFRTVKYSTAGVQLLNVAYDFVDDDRADFIDVNTDGSFAVTGRSDALATAFVNYNFRTVKYSSAGVQQWTATYEGTGANDDVVQGIDLTAAGDVLISGYSDANATIAIQNNIVSIKYNSAGAALWTKVYNGIANLNDESSACIVDSQGNARIAGHTENEEAQRDALLLTLDNSGNTTNTATINGTGDNSDNAREIAVDNAGNIFVCGYSVGKETDRNMFLMKLSTSGDTLWTRSVSGTLFGSDEEANAMVIDNNGNVIMSGYTKNSGTGSDITILKYNTSGALLWTAQYNGTANESDRSYDITTDATGNIYVTGKTDINASPIITNDEIFTAKYSPTGLLLWSSTHAGNAGIDRGRKIHISSSGNVYICGYKWNGTDNDLVVIKYSNAGVQQWIYTYSSAQDEAFKYSAIDSNENIYLLADSNPIDNPTATDIRIIKVSPTGSLAWSQTFIGGNNLPCNSQEIAVNGSGEVFIVGSIATQVNPLYLFDALVAKYTTDGVLVWQRQYDGTNGLNDEGDAITNSQNGQIMVAYHTNDGTESDIHYSTALRAIDASTGTELESYNYSNSDTLTIPNDIIATASGVLVAGSTWNDNSQRDILVQRFDVTLHKTEIAKQSLSVYPNPANDNIVIQTETSMSGETARIFDSSGCVVQTISLQSSSTPCSIQHLSAGFYFIQIDNNPATNVHFIKY